MLSSPLPFLDNSGSWLTPSPTMHWEISVASFPPLVAQTLWCVSLAIFPAPLSSQPPSFATLATLKSQSWTSPIICLLYSKTSWMYLEKITQLFRLASLQNQVLQLVSPNFKLLKLPFLDSFDLLIHQEKSKLCFMFPQLFVATLPYVLVRTSHSSPLLQAQRKGCPSCLRVTHLPALWSSLLLPQRPLHFLSPLSL